MKIKTTKQYNRDKKRCTYCGGTGLDIFDKTKSCPFCTAEIMIIDDLTPEEKREIIDEKIHYETRLLQLKNA